MNADQMASLWKIYPADDWVWCWDDQVWHLATPEIEITCYPDQLVHVSWGRRFTAHLDTSGIADLGAYVQSLITIVRGQKISRGAK